MKGRPKGYKVSDKTKKLISKKLKGRIFSEETIEKMRIGQLNGNNNSRGKRGTNILIGLATGQDIVVFISG